MIKRKFDLSVMTVCFVLIGYFAWYGFEGPRGFKYRDGLTAKVAELDKKLAAVETRSAALEQHVQLMRPESVDPDLLDELARRTLDYSKPNDLILRIPQ
ncbi:septum formation initiator family protein [soil metagenome]